MADASLHHLTCCATGRCTLLEEEAAELTSPSTMVLGEVRTTSLQIADKTISSSYQLEANMSYGVLSGGGIFSLIETGKVSLLLFYLLI